MSTKERIEMTEPNEDLLTLMEQPERKAVLGQPPASMLSAPMNPDQLGHAFQEVLAVKTVGKMIAAARAQRQMSARQVAERVNASHPRVLAVEKSGIDIEIRTLVNYAEALGYDVQLSLKPRDGGQEITASLTPVLS